MKLRRVLSALVIFSAGAGLGYVAALVRTNPEAKAYCASLIAKSEERLEGFLNRIVRTSAHGSARATRDAAAPEVPAVPVEVRSAYIRESVILSDVSAKADSAEAAISSVSGKIKNSGNRVVGRVLLTAYLMQGGKIVFETSFAPLGDVPLKPEESRDFTYKVDNIPQGLVAGSVRASITDIAFLQ